jgi:hypothetical protein
MTQNPWRKSNAGLGPGQVAIAVGLVAVLWLITSGAAGSLMPFNPAARGADITPLWFGSAALLHAIPFEHLTPYQQQAFFYPPPYLVAFAPLALLKLEVAGLVARAVAAGLLVAVVVGWAHRRRPVPPLAWLLCLSLPAVQAVFLGQVTSAVGLTAFSLAIWAQRRDRWVLVGVAMGVGCLRLANAIPLIAILLVGGWRKPAALGRALLAALAVLAPMVILVLLWDPDWTSSFLTEVGGYPFGFLTLVGSSSRPAVLVIVLSLVAVTAAFWVRTNAGMPLGLDRSAGALALGVAAAPMSSVYTFVFLLPALTRLAARRDQPAMPLLAFVVPWVLAVSPPVAGFGQEVTTVAAEMVVIAATLIVLLRHPNPPAFAFG